MYMQAIIEIHTSINLQIGKTSPFNVGKSYYIDIFPSIIMMMSKHVAGLVKFVPIWALADPGGCRRRANPPPPQQDPILLFSHMFSLKSSCVGGRRPPTARRPPMGNPGSATAKSCRAVVGCCCQCFT